MYYSIWWIWSSCTTVWIENKKKSNILFFYRRGRDSAGVTDRVVNQLLTELDGVESLGGKNFN